MTTLKEEEEEEGEAGHSRDNTTKKRKHTYHPSVISYPWPFDRVVQIFRWDELCVVARPRTHETECSIRIGSSQRPRHHGPPTSSQSWCWRVCTLDFYRVHQMILPPSTNLDQNQGGLKIRPRISPWWDVNSSHCI